MKTISKIPQAKLKASPEETKDKDPAERSALHQKTKEKAQAQAINDARKKVKADRAQKWEDAKGKKGPDQKPPKTKLNKEEKDQVKNALHDAAHRMKNTANIPHNKDEFEVGGQKSSGKDVRKAVMNSYLHGPVPVGRGDNKLPKTFRNDPYSASHGDASLRGVHPIDNPTGAKLQEYPVKPQGQGWVGTGSVGAHRVITSNEGGHDTFHGVIGHDKNRSGDKDDHYLANVTPHTT